MGGVLTTLLYSGSLGIEGRPWPSSPVPSVPAPSPSFAQTRSALFQGPDRSILEKSTQYPLRHPDHRHSTSRNLPETVGQTFRVQLPLLPPSPTDRLCSAPGSFPVDAVRCLWPAYSLRLFPLPRGSREVGIPGSRNLGETPGIATDTHTRGLGLTAWFPDRGQEKH